ALPRRRPPGIDGTPLLGPRRRRRAPVAARHAGHAARRAAPGGRARADVGRARGRIHERRARFVAPRGRGGARHGGRADPHLLREVRRAGLRWLVDRLPTSTGKVTLEFLLKQFVAGADRPLIERHLTWFGALGPDARVLAWAGGLLNGFPGDSSLNRVLWLDFLTYLPDN